MLLLVLLMYSCSCSKLQTVSSFTCSYNGCFFWMYWNFNKRHSEFCLWGCVSRNPVYVTANTTNRTRFLLDPYMNGRVVILSSLILQVNWITILFLRVVDSSRATWTRLAIFMSHDSSLQLWGTIQLSSRSIVIHLPFNIVIIWYSR